MPVARQAETVTTHAPRLLLSVTARAALGVVVGHIDTLSENGWDVHVLVGERTEPRLLPRATVHVVPMARGRSWRRDLVSYQEVSRTIARVRPDVVVGATPKAAALTLRAARRLGVPRRVWWVWGYRHENSANVLGRAVELDAGRTATHIVAASQSLADVLRRKGICAQVLGAGSIAGVDLDVFQPRPTRLQRSAAPRVAFVGRLSSAKGVDHLARIWPKVVQCCPQAKLLLAGEPDPLDRADGALEQLRGTPGVDQLGFVEEMPTVLQGVDLLAHPSRREGLPAVVLEAAASAVPAVVWNVTGCRDAVVDGSTGRVVNYGDEAGFAQAVTALLEDVERRTRMGNSARLRAQSSFARSIVEEQFATFLARLLPAFPDELVLVDAATKRAPGRLHSVGAQDHGPGGRG